MEMRNKIAAVSIGAITFLSVVGGLAAMAGAQDRTPPAATADTGAAAGTEEQDPMLNGSITVADHESLSEADEAAALEGLATISAADAEQAATAAVPGTASPAELENENGSVVYEVKVVDADGMEHEVIVDAGNGAVLAQEQDDEGSEDEANEGPEDEANEGPEDEAEEGPEAGDATN
jgi:uncharacterized membrane protein YkoI